MLSPARAQILKPLLDSLLDRTAMAQRVMHDPVKFSRRYARQDDIEVAALISSCLAYGRADLFMVQLEQIFAIMGAHPGAFAHDFDPRRDASRFAGIKYRFNVAADIVALIAAAGHILQAHSRLGSVFEDAFCQSKELRPAMACFVTQIKSQAKHQAIERWLGPAKAFDHLLPDPSRGSACKRLLLFLRWMVRGGPGDPIDFGLWKGIPTSALIIPLDTHVARIGRNLGFTERSANDWNTAVQITAALRQLDPLDPTKYDFALCHLGMSGICPGKRTLHVCARCVLTNQCKGTG